MRSVALLVASEPEESRPALVPREAGKRWELMGTHGKPKVLLKDAFAGFAQVARLQVNGLENRKSRKRFGGSNPSPPALTLGFASRLWAGQFRWLSQTRSLPAPARFEPRLPSPEPESERARRLQFWEWTRG
jgi:hypothetical protein